MIRALTAIHFFSILLSFFGCLNLKAENLSVAVEMTAAAADTVTSRTAETLWPIKYNEQVAFSIADPAGHNSAAARANEASKALAAAIEAKKPAEIEAWEDQMRGKENLVEVIVENDVAKVLVRRNMVMALYPADANAAGFSDLKDYAERIHLILEDFVPRQMQKARIQDIFLRIFLSVFFALLGFLVVRQLGRLFNRFDAVLEEKRGNLKPVTFMSETLLTGDAVEGLLSFGLIAGRVISYIAAVTATVAAIMGQFDFTRRILVKSLSSGATQIFGGLENLVRTVPSILLAVFLIIVLYTSVRIFNLLLLGIGSGRIHWKAISAGQAPVVRVLGSITIVVLFGFLIVGSFFNRFHTPLEILLLIFGGALFLAAIPLGASYAVGVTVLWRSQIRPGDWIEVGPYHGEVIKVDFGEISIVPLHGGRLTIPMLTLLIRPIHHVQKLPRLQLQFDLKPTQPVRDLIRAVTELADASLEPEVELNEIGHDKVRLTLFISAIKTQARENLMLAVADAMESHRLVVLHCQFVESSI